MTSPRQVQRAGTRVLSGAMLVVGIALLASTLARGGGPVSVGVVLGVMFCILGAGRLWTDR